MGQRLGQRLGQGLDPSSAESTFRPLDHVLDRIHVVQIDSVNYFERSHYLPAFSRLGGYDKSGFDAAAFGAEGVPATVIEYMAHEATLIDPADFPLFRWRMNHFRQKSFAAKTWANENTKLFDQLKAELHNFGPMLADQFSVGNDGARHEHWSTTRSSAKRALHLMFLWGDVVTSGRDRFSRRYALPEQVLAADILNEPNISEADAHVELIARAIAALGIGTAKDLGDYYRMNHAKTRHALATLLDQGRIIRVHIPEWEEDNGIAYTSPEILETNIKPAAGAALLSPFDPLVWYRPRTKRVFDFHYRLEIYTPSHKRKYGYYCLPILLDDRIMGRVDVKNNRQTRTLEVRAAWSEPSMQPGDAARVVKLLQHAQLWQDLDQITIFPQGNFAAELQRNLPSPSDR